MNKGLALAMAFTYGQIGLGLAGLAGREIGPIETFIAALGVLGSKPSKECFLPIGFPPPTAYPRTVSGKVLKAVRVQRRPSS